MHKKTSVGDSFFSPVQLQAKSLQLFKEGLRYNWFPENFQKIFKMTFLQKRLWTAASIVLT